MTHNKFEINQIGKMNLGNEICYDWPPDKIADIHSPAIICDSSLNIIKSNELFFKLSGYEPSILSGKIMATGARNATGKAPS